MLMFLCFYFLELLNKTSLSVTEHHRGTILLTFSWLSIINENYIHLEFQIFTYIVNLLTAGKKVILITIKTNGVFIVFAKL